MDHSIENEKVKRNVDLKYILKSLIGIAIMVFFRFLPAPEPITPAGMAVLGEFIGLIYLWSAVDMMWPTFLAIVLFGFDAYAIFPDSWQLAGVYESGAQSFGNYIVIFYLGCLLIVHALSKAGTFKRVCMWFVTRSAAKKSPVMFTFMLLLATFIISLFLDVSAAQILMLAIVHQMFEVLGFKKGDRWPKYIVMAITFTCILGFAMTPICHTLPILFMGIYSSMTGVAANMLIYMAVGIPVGAVIWIVMILWLFKVVKMTKDVPELENIDWDKIQEMKPPRMEIREKIIILITGLLIICWLIPAILALVVPESGLYQVMHIMTDTSFLLLAVVVLAILKIGGKPLLDLADAFKNLPWLAIILLAGIMLIAGVLGEPTTGISAFLMNIITPITENMSPFMLVAVLSIGCIILTNIANSVPVGIIFMTIGVPLCMSMGFNPLIVAIAVSITANLTYTIPPAFVPIAYAYADPYGDGKTILINGLFMCLASCVISVILIYPLASLFS